MSLLLLCAVIVEFPMLIILLLVNW
jgi:hypothetical protein